MTLNPQTFGHRRVIMQKHLPATKSASNCERWRAALHEAADVSGFVLEDDEADRRGTKAIQGLVINLPKSEKLQVNAFAFTKMKRLNLLHLNYVLLSGSYEHLSGRLAWLSWKRFPLKCIPATLIMDKMVAIDLSYSRLRQLWIGTKVLTKLKYLNLGHSYFLIQTPDFAGLPSLEILLLNDCTELVWLYIADEQ